MAFIGNTNTTQGFTPAIDYFSGNGSTTAFTLSRPVASTAQVQVTVNNVPQNPSTAYGISGNTLTFTSAPASGTNNIYVYYTSPITQVIAPGQNTVYPSSLSYTNALYWDTSGNVGIGTTSPTSLSATSKTIQVSSANTGYGTVLVDSNGVATGQFYATTDGTPLVAIGSRTNHPLILVTNNTEQARIDSTGLFKFNSGYGSAATAYGCRAWVNFNGTTATPSTIRGSGNVSSVTKNGTGNYTINFATAMPDANFSPIVNATQAADTNFTNGITAGEYAATTGGVSIKTGKYSAGLQDQDIVCVSVFR